MQKPSPGKKERAGITIAAIILAVFVIFVSLRIVWHADVQEDDPRSLEAPERQLEAEPPAADLMTE